MTDYRTTADSILKWAQDRDFEGDDFYWRSTERYPMALGYFLRAACALSERFPHDSFYTEVAEQLTSSILARSNLLGRSRYHHWGLPFPWPTLDDTEHALSGDFYWDPDNPLFSGPLPAHSGYGVTTAIVGHGLIDWLELSGSDELREVIEQVAHWCVEDCGYRLVDGKVFFNYAPAMNHQIYNGSALVAAFLSRAAGLLGNDEWAGLAASAMSLVSDLQDERGGWVYAKERQEVEYHYGYNLESVALYHRATGDSGVLPTIERGTDYYIDRLIDPDGRCYDNDEKLSETRLWAYGWAISGLMHAAAAVANDTYVERAKTIAAYMTDNLWVEDVGAFRFKRHHESFYMRDEAHAAYGFAMLAVAAP